MVSLAMKKHLRMIRQSSAGARVELNAAREVIGKVVSAKKSALLTEFIELEKKRTSICLKDLAKQAAGCACHACMAGGVGFPQLTREDVEKGGVLAAISDRRSEARAHGATEGDLPGPALGKYLTKLINAKAFRLTGGAVAAPAAQTTCPAPEAAAVGEPHARPSPDTADSPTGSPARQRARPSPPSPLRVLTRSDTGALEFVDPRQLPRLDFSSASEKVSPSLAYAFKCITTQRCFLYQQYKLAALGRYDEEPLNCEQFAKCTALVFGVSQRVLQRALRRGIDVSSAVHRGVRRGGHGGHDKHYPLFAHVDGHRVLAVDTAWPTRGYLSDHGVTHVVDIATGIILAVCQITKKARPASFAAIDLDPPVVFGFLRNSGDMDAEGMDRCLTDLLECADDVFSACGVCKDGDAKSKAAGAFSTLWWDARCKCHVVKNVAKLMRKMSSACKCPGGCGGSGGSCNYKKGWRFSPGQVGSVAGRLFVILREAERMYLPELEEVMMPRYAADGPGSAEREVNRKLAILWAQAEVDALYLHVVGDHSRCSHRDLDTDPEKPHPRLQCEPQKRYLAGVLLSVSDIMGDLLTPFGLVDVNQVESDHAIIAKFRPKEYHWGAIACFTGTNLALLDIQQLKLATWGDRTFPILDLAEELKAELGIDIGITEEEVEAMVDKLDRRLKDKARRSGEEWTKKRKTWAARKHARVKSGKRSSYASGGTEESLTRALASVELEVAGEASSVGDPLESWHGSDLVLDETEVAVIEGADESDDE
jgi:hypothetical protein